MSIPGTFEVSSLKPPTCEFYSHYTGVTCKNEAGSTIRTFGDSPKFVHYCNVHAADIVNALQQLGYIRKQHNYSPEIVANVCHDLKNEPVTHIFWMMFSEHMRPNSKKIPAIKWVRKNYQTSLKEAKEIVERMWALEP
jgi:hypothetical protein